MSDLPVDLFLVLGSVLVWRVLKMLDLTVGMKVFHNGVPVELLHCMGTIGPRRSTTRRDMWKVRPLFVVENDREEMFMRSDRITFLHTNTRVKR